MNLASLTVSDFTRIQKLLQKKQDLAGRINAIDQQLSAFEGGIAAPAKRGRPKAGQAPNAGRTVKVKKQKRGETKAKITQMLKDAGKSGLAVKDLAKKLGVPYGNVSVWFFSTGKKIKQIKKTAPGHYVWVA